MNERRDEILDVAKQMFARQGVRETTVRQIGAEAGVLSGSLYYHFRSKLDIVDAILERFCAEMVSSYEKIAASEGPAVDRLGELVRQGLQLIADDTASVLMFQREAQSLGDDERFTYLRTTEKTVERLWVKVLEDGQATQELRPDFNVRITYRILRDVIASSARWRSPSVAADKRTAEEIVNIVLNGIAARPA